MAVVNLSLQVCCVSFCLPVHLDSVVQKTCWNCRDLVQKLRLPAAKRGPMNREKNREIEEYWTLCPIDHGNCPSSVQKTWVNSHSRANIVASTKEPSCVIVPLWSFRCTSVFCCSLLVKLSDHSVRDPHHKWILLHCFLLVFWSGIFNIPEQRQW